MLNHDLFTLLDGFSQHKIYILSLLKMSMEKIIAQGAEAILIHKDGKLIKRRAKKGYRNPELDKKIRQGRTRREAKILEKAGKIIPIPKVLSVNEKNAEIDMEYIEGKKLSDHLDEFSSEKALEICRLIGENVAKLHDADMIHGDLTTSNMIYSVKEKKLYFIDFGLGIHSKRAEDKAVDLHLLKQAFESKHFVKWKEYFDVAIRSYEKESKNSDRTLLQLKKVEARGRYKGKH